jgi:SSS family transporter
MAIISTVVQHSSEAVPAAAETAADVGAKIGLGLSQSGMYTLYCGIIIYILGILAVGFFAGRKVKGISDFLVAGRRLPLWMATGTLLATWFGAGSSMGVAATVFSSGIGSVIADPFAASISLILAGIFIVGLLRKLKCLTVTDIIERRFGKWAGIYASIWMVPVYVGWLGAQVLGMGTILHVLLGIDIVLGSWIGAAIVLIYTVVGGMWAVTMTDLIQVSLIIIGLFVIVPQAVSMAGGFDMVFSEQNVRLSELSLSYAANATEGGWVYYIGQWIIMGFGCMVGQDLVQRSLASRNERIAISSSIISGFLYLGIALVPITIGFAARIVLAKNGITVDSMGGEAALENQVLPRMAVITLGQFNPIFLTVFLSALISAIMSSADSSLLAASSLVSNNVLRSIYPRVSDATLLHITRITTVVLLIVATVLALSVESIYALMKNCWASQLVVVFLPVIISLYFKKASKYTCWAVMSTSTFIWLVYCFVGAVGIEGSFVEIMGSDEFDIVLTNGAVYGFIAGIIAFITSYLGERLCLKVTESEYEED